MKRVRGVLCRQFWGGRVKREVLETGCREDGIRTRVSEGILVVLGKLMEIESRNGRGSHVR